MFKINGLKNKFIMNNIFNTNKYSLPKISRTFFMMSNNIIGTNTNNLNLKQSFNRTHGLRSISMHLK